MIIEIIGPPGSGKSFVSKKILMNHEFISKKEMNYRLLINSKLSFLFKGLVFFCYNLNLKWWFFEKHITEKLVRFIWEKKFFKDYEFIIKNKFLNRLNDNNYSFPSRIDTCLSYVFLVKTLLLKYLVEKEDLHFLIDEGIVHNSSTESLKELIEKGDEFKLLPEVVILVKAPKELILKRLEKRNLVYTIPRHKNMNHSQLNEDTEILINDFSEKMSLLKGLSETKVFFLKNDSCDIDSEIIKIINYIKQGSF